MKIIAGLARNVDIKSPDTIDVRPTSIRARKALFDSLGDFTNKSILDLFSGSGALSLEAGSRGASKCVLIENNKLHGDIIRENISIVQKANVSCNFNLLIQDALNLASIVKNNSFDMIFADPPYPISVDMFSKFYNNKAIIEKLKGALLIWEIPNTPGAVGQFMEAASNGNEDDSIMDAFRNFGGVWFFIKEL
jgi:16S rRNA (guanine966-N2)-methyltransferase